jgi:hypothetical protein
MIGFLNSIDSMDGFHRSKREARFIIISSQVAEASLIVALIESENSCLERKGVEAREGERGRAQGLTTLID